jgi:hypothetical protein
MKQKIYPQQGAQARPNVSGILYISIEEVIYGNSFSKRGLGRNT